MRYHIALTNKQKEALGHMVVAFVLAVAIALMGCDAPGAHRSASIGGKGTATSTPSNSSPPEIVPASRVVTTEEPASSATGPVAFEDGASAYRDHRYDEARRLFTAYTTQHPRNAWGFYLLGLSARNAGDPVQAESAFTAALERDPTHLKSRINLVRALLDQHRFADAVEQADSALALDDTSSDAYRLLGVAKQGLGQVDEAIEAYRQAASLDANDAWSPNDLGFLYIRLGRFEEALPPLARAVALAPDVPVFQNNLGTALERTGHVGQAADAFRAALAADSTYDKARVSLDRVRDRAVTPGVAPVDLSALAQEFVEGLAENPSVDTLDTTATKPKDTTSVPADTTVRITPPTSVLPDSGPQAHSR